MISYPLAVVNVFVALGLLILYRYPYWASTPQSPEPWSPPFRATWPVALFFMFSNIYLVIAPFVPPSAGQNVYKSLPYYLHCVVGLGIFGVGAIYWLIWSKVVPYFGGYTLVREDFVGSDGWSGHIFKRIPRNVVH